MTRIGLPLEIVPLKDPKTIKAGEAFPLQIFYKDKPLVGETIIATSDTFVVKDMEAATSHREPQAFSGKTDSEGKVNFIPLIEGVWKLKVIHKEPFEDQKVCQQSANYATLILPVGKARLNCHQNQNIIINYKKVRSNLTALFNMFLTLEVGNVQ